MVQRRAGGKRERANLYLDASLLVRLQHLAIDERVNVSTLVERIVREHLDRMEIGGTK